MELSTALFEVPFLGTILVKHFVIIAYLIILEGLLSFDNALALAALVKGRLKDPKDQQRALTWGIWGAYIFRTLVIFVGTWLMAHWQVKLVAGGYLVYLAISELFFAGKASEDGENEVGWLNFKWMTPLVSTIVAVEIMDVMFSIDSIGVALALTDEKWVLILGAILGIIMMRFAAKGFIKLIDKFPILEKTAFVLVGFAGLNVVLKVGHAFGYDLEIPEGIFTAGLLTIFIGSFFVNKYFYPKQLDTQEKDAA